MNELILSFENQSLDITFQDVDNDISKRCLEEIQFSESIENCCMGIINMDDSKRIIGTLSQMEMYQYYKIFLNWMGVIIQDHGGIIVKNIRNNLTYYFYDIGGNVGNSSLKNMVDCGFAMIAARNLINDLMKKLDLPSVDFRIYLDYGDLTIIRHSNSIMGDDIFGTTVNLFSKLVEDLSPNQIIVGNDLYEKIRMFEECKLQPTIGKTSVQKLYSTYLLSRTTNFDSSCNAFSMEV